MTYDWDEYEYPITCVLTQQTSIYGITRNIGEEVVAYKYEHPDSHLCHMVQIGIPAEEKACGRVWCVEERLQPICPRTKTRARHYAEDLEAGIF